jgi:dienelactone hydrolase
MRKLLVALGLLLPAAVLAQEYTPQKTPARVVIVISGASGAVNYQDIAQDAARLGYYTVLLDGNHVMVRRDPAAGAAILAQAIERAQGSPHAAPGKVAVVGFSLGGGAALSFAARMPDKVSTVVAYYPTTSFITGALTMENYVKRFEVPVLVLAGGQDRYRNCCLVESMRAMESAAKARSAAFELVVYPDGDHGFNRNGPAYRRDYDTDAWKRTTEALRKALAD